MNEKYKERSAREQALEWVQNYIKKKDLKSGDILPKEIEIMTAAGVSRSAVREAMTALKTLGIVISRKKEGTRLVREPVILDLRKYLKERFDSKDDLEEALEFRASMEWGMGELLFNRVKADTLKKLQKIVDASKGKSDLESLDRDFHTILLKAAGNKLAALLSYLIIPVFATRSEINDPPSKKEIDVWITQHQPLIDTLRKKDKKGFLREWRKHTFIYFR
jgi:DNA-binding FadR family transcriptional regulator